MEFSTTSIHISAQSAFCLIEVELILHTVYAFFICVPQNRTILILM
jgi:hypothetical protein